METKTERRFKVGQEMWVREGSVIRHLFDDRLFTVHVNDDTIDLTNHETGKRSVVGVVNPPTAKYEYEWNGEVLNHVKEVVKY